MSRYLLVFFGALLLGGSVLFGMSATGCLRTASAQVSDPVGAEFNLTKGERYLIENGPTSTKAADPANAKQRVWSRAARKTFGRGLATRVAVRGGLAGVAAGIWIHNGMTLYYGLKGQPKQVVQLDTEFQHAREGSPPFARVTVRNRDGQIERAAIILDADYAWDGSAQQCTWDVDYVVRAGVEDPFLTPQIGIDGYEGFRDDGWGSSDVYCGGSSYVTESHASFWPRTQDESGGGPDARFFTSGDDGRRYGAPFSPLESWHFHNPVYDVGGSEVTTDAPATEYTPPDDSYVSQPSETKEFVDNIQSDPEYDPSWEGDDKPSPVAVPPTVKKLADEHGGLVSTRTNPDGSTTYRFGDGTEFTTWPDGTELTRDPTGFEHWKYPDGTERTYDPKTGIERTTYPDGTTRERQYPDGTRPNEIPNTTPDSTTWTDPDGGPLPDGNPDPNTYGNPNDKPSPDSGTPTNPDGSGQPGCQTPRKSSFDLPEIDVQDKFPFSLILWLVQSIEQLASPPQDAAPTLTMPFGGENSFQWSFTNMQGTVSLMRNLVWFFGTMFLVIGFYVLIKGGSKTE